MKKIICSLYAAGIALVTCSIPSIEDFLYNMLYSYFSIKLPEVDGNLCMIIGLCIIVLATYMYFKVKEKIKTMSIIGLDYKYQADDLPNTYPIDIRNSIKKLNNRNSSKIINDFDNDLSKFIDNNMNKGKSYYGVAPIPFVAIAGTRFRKERIINHYEYNSSNGKVSKLNSIPAFLLPKMNVDRILNDNSNSVICISTTSVISNSDLEQFKEYNLLHFYVEKCKDNLIVSESQLSKYSDLIVKEIYEISRLKKGKIYVIGACQSSLIFEIFRKINLNRSLEIVVCNYQKTANPRYNWGICIKKGDIRYEELVVKD